MNFKNIWDHPKTSAAGLLIAVASVAGVLSQQGVTLGKVGTGTVVSLASALATALLGLMAKDPGQGSGVSDQGSGSTQKLAAWMLIALLIPLPWMQGCTAAGVAENIVNWTPSLQSAVATVDSTAALLAPADAPIFTAATVGFDAASNLLVAQAKAYLANPSGSALAKLQNQIVTLQQQVNTAAGYPFDSGPPNRLCFGLFPFDGGFHNLSVGCWFDCDRLLHQAVEEFASAARFAAVEAEREFV